MSLELREQNFDNSVNVGIYWEGEQMTGRLSLWEIACHGATLYPTHIGPTKKHTSRRFFIEWTDGYSSRGVFIRLKSEHTMKIKEGLFSSPKRYRAPWRHRLSPLLTTCAGVAFLWILTLCETASSRSSAAGALGLFSLFLLALGALWCLTTWGTWILVAPEGLLYRSPGTCVYTPWKNIEDVEKRIRGWFEVEHLRLRREAVEILSLEEGVQEQIAVITRVGIVRAIEGALPGLRVLALVLVLLSIFAGGRARYVGRASKSPLQKYIPIGFFGSAWKDGALGLDISRYREATRQQQA